jgi:hypothetical protein
MSADDIFYGNVVPGDLFTSKVADAGALVISVRRATLAETYFAKPTVEQRRSHRAVTSCNYNFVTVCMLCCSTSSMFDRSIVYRTAHVNVEFAVSEFWNHVRTSTEPTQESDESKR